ncbi:MAG TPA: type II secretion system protein [Candidatus Paceibacterota bacterium]|nr:type II secretion system protein [Candidatus Paceibacterota bacterium]
MFKTRNNFKKRNSGFTLVEVIVAVGIFSLVMLVAMGAVLSIVGANKKAQSLHNVINNFNLAVESMVRDMRTGYQYVCGGDSDSCSAATTFSFKSTQSSQNDVAQDITYRLENDYITKRVGSSGDAVRLTSEEVKVNRLEFYMRGGTSGDLNQPLVIVLIEGEATIGGEVSRFNLQTLVSQRQIDI